MSELFEQPKKDNFEHESPIRAFTDFNIKGRYAVGKGFRPSIQHLATYLDALEAKEGWQLVQLLDIPARVPTMLFRKVTPAMYNIVPSLPAYDLATPKLREYMDRLAEYEAPYRNPAKAAIDREIGGKMSAAESMAEIMDQFPDAVACDDPTCHVSKHLHFHLDGNFVDDVDPASRPEALIPNKTWTIAGLDPETTHHSKAMWSHDVATTLRPAMESMKGQALSDFLKAEKVINITQYFSVASVASVLRLIRRLDWEDRLHLLSPIDPATREKAATLTVDVTERTVAKHPALGEPYTPDWRMHASDTPIPDDHYMEAAEYVIRRSCADQRREKYVDQTLRDFRTRFAPPKNHACLSHKGLASQLGFVMSSASMLRIKQLIDAFRLEKALEVTSDLYEAMAEVIRNTDDPINPKHYAGRECADIGERLSANGYQILKYCWRLGKKDDPCQELGKSIWYGESEAQLLALFPAGQYRYPDVWGLPGDDNGESWFEERIADQPQFTQNIARMLWQGYNTKRLSMILEAIQEQQFHMDCGRGLAI